MPDSIAHEPHSPDAWICLCGNRPTEDDFYPCHTDGTQTDPTEGWPDLYTCARCHRIIDGKTRMIQRPQSRPLQPRITTAVEKAEDAFWATIVTHFPEAQSGDLAPLIAHQLTDTMHQALNAWIDANCPHLRYSLGQYVLYTGTKGPDQKTLGIVERDGVHCLDPEVLAAFAETHNSPVCLWTNIQHLEPWTSPSDEELTQHIIDGQTLERTQRLVLLNRTAEKNDGEAQAVIDAHHQRFDEF